MYYISSQPNEFGNYGNPMQNFFNECYNLPDNLLTPYIEARGFVNFTLDDNTVTAIETNQEALGAYLAANPDPDILEVAKEQRIQQSNDDLEKYLADHPLLWTDGKYYTITRAKQQQLTSKILSATLAKSMGTPYNLTWNDTGEVCKSWTLENLSALAFAIDARVTALVTYQQTQEVAMRNAESLEALEAIVVDYDTVK